MGAEPAPLRQPDGRRFLRNGCRLSVRHGERGGNLLDAAVCGAATAGLTLAIAPARVQSDDVMLLRAMLVLAMMLNGTALPPAAATDNAPDIAAHAGYHGMDHPSDQAPAGQPFSDCCDGMGCGCGCAGPQMVTPPVAAMLRAWDRATAVFASEVAPFSASLIAAPFRPPA